MLGSHLSIAGSLSNALRKAESYAFDSVQVFTKNQQQWKAPPLKDDEVRLWHAEVSRLGWNAAGGRTVAHASYLINLASPDDALWQKSIDLMLEEIRRCEALAIPFLVHHPGAYTASSLDAGLQRIAAAYEHLFAATPGFRTISCLENTAGGGSTIGRDFTELARLRSMILDRAGRPAANRIAFCLDTCHAHAAGYDLSSESAARRAIDLFHKHCGLDHLRVLHLNDSKGALGSRIDRHAHIGDGAIGLPGFRGVLRHPALRAAPRPMILETPKGTNPAGKDWDAINAARLRRILQTPRA